MGMTYPLRGLTSAEQIQIFLERALKELTEYEGLESIKTDVKNALDQARKML